MVEHSLVVDANSNVHPEKVYMDILLNMVYLALRSTIDKVNETNIVYIVNIVILANMINKIINFNMVNMVNVIYCHNPNDTCDIKQPHLILKM